MLVTTGKPAHWRRRGPGSGSGDGLKAFIGKKEKNSSLMQGFTRVFEVKEREIVRMGSDDHPVARN